LAISLEMGAGYTPGSYNTDINVLQSKPPTEFLMVQEAFHSTASFFCLLVALYQASSLPAQSARMYNEV